MTDLPKISAGSTHSNQVYSYTPSTSLPSISLLREHTAHQPEHVNKPTSPFGSEQQSCFCSTMRPMLKDVVDAVLELESSIQFRGSGFPKSVRMPQRLAMVLCSC